ARAPCARGRCRARGCRNGRRERCTTAPPRPHPRPRTQPAGLRTRARSRVAAERSTANGRRRGDPASFPGNAARTRAAAGARAETTRRPAAEKSAGARTPRRDCKRMLYVFEMKIRPLIGNGKPCFSFEFFPPKDDDGVASLFHTIGELRELEPTFVSVTYGAGGSTRDRTVELVGRIRRVAGIEAMAHLTCVGHSKDELAAVLDRLA